MKKLMLFISGLLLVSCNYSDEVAMQDRVVNKVETNDTHGYKYRVEVKHVARKGIATGKYVLLTDENYKVGDTIRIK